MSFSTGKSRLVMTKTTKKTGDKKNLFINFIFFKVVCKYTMFLAQIILRNKSILYISNLQYKEENALPYTDQVINFLTANSI